MCQIKWYRNNISALHNQKFEQNPQGLRGCDCSVNKMDVNNHEHIDGSCILLGSETKWDLHLGTKCKALPAPYQVFSSSVVICIVQQVWNIVGSQLCFLLQVPSQTVPGIFLLNHRSPLHSLSVKRKKKHPWAPLLTWAELFFVMRKFVIWLQHLLHVDTQWTDIG